MEHNSRMSIPMTGGSSLLVIFAVLCLTVFALLGLSTVQADQRLSKNTVQAVSAYYQADRQAEEILARLRCGDIPRVSAPAAAKPTAISIPVPFQKHSSWW